MVTVWEAKAISTPGGKVCLTPSSLRHSRILSLWPTRTIFHPVRLGSLDGSQNRSLGGVIAAHCVYNDFHTQLLTAVLTAGPQFDRQSPETAVKPLSTGHVFSP